MFTGIITDVGTVRRIERSGDTRIEIETRYDTHDIELGASIACSGPCLTVVEKGRGWFAVEASAETLSRTSLGGVLSSWRTTWTGCTSVPSPLQRPPMLRLNELSVRRGGCYDGTATVGPSAFGSLKNIRTITRM